MQLSHATLLPLLALVLPSLALPASPQDGGAPAAPRAVVSRRGLQERLNRMEEIRTSMYGYQANAPIPANLNDDSLLDKTARTDSFAAAAAAASSTVEPSAGCTQCVSSLKFAGAAAKKYQVGTQM